MLPTNSRDMLFLNQFVSIRLSLIQKIPSLLHRFRSTIGVTTDIRQALFQISITHTMEK